MKPKMPLTEEARRAESLKEEGNLCFNKRLYNAAIERYTEAITLCSNVPVFYTNRALCYLKRSEWVKVEDDCRKALQLDGNLVKAHYMLGLALLQKLEYTEGVIELERALDLERGANSNGSFLEEIWQELSKAKYFLWEQVSSQRSWELQNLKETCEMALKEKHMLDTCYTETNENNDDSHSKQLETLGRVFKKAAEDDTPAEVPDYLCCRVSLDIFRDPVITPSGVTYERAVILEHLKKVGKFDPITREPLQPSQLVPNFAIKEAVQAFLDKHGWAYRSG